MIARPERLALVLVLQLLLLAGCVHALRDPNCLAPAGSLRYCLLPPSALMEIADGAPRLVHISGADIDQHMLSQLAVSDATLRLYASSLLGQPLFEIRYTANAIELLPDNAPVKAAWLLAMLQIAHADVAAVNGALTRARLETDGENRLLVQGHDMVMVVMTQAGATEIFLPAAELRIRIERVDAGSETP